VAIDRDEALRKAEKLLRQGRLDEAIAEYERVVSGDPGDMATATSLGDLYGRAGKAQQAVGQFMRIGEQWLRDGNYAKAAASFKKVLKHDSQHEPALLQLVEACAQQGQIKAAKAHLKSALDRRQASGDVDGADALAIRLSELDPSDFEAKVAAVHIRVRTGKARPADLLELTRELDVRGQIAEAETLLEKVVELDPSANEVRLHLSRAALGRNDLERARTFLPDTAKTTDATLLLTAGEIHLKLGALDQARALLGRYLALAPEGVEAVAALADASASQAARYGIVDLLVDEASASHDYRRAARRLQGFLEHSPRHIPALLRLVEVCVDGDLDSALTSAQEELAEAYLDAKEAEKARVIAEDLLLRHPRSMVHRDRLRRALVAIGEDDPDGVIADRLGFVDMEEEPDVPAPDAPIEPAGARATAAPESTAAAPADDEAVDFEPVEFEAWEEGSIDLTEAVDQLAPGGEVSVDESDRRMEPASPADEETAAVAPSPFDTGASSMLDKVFASLRGKASQDPTLPPGDHAARNFRVGQTYAAANMVREASESFEQSARDPRYRFRSAQTLGRLYRKHGMLKEALEWLDIASEAPAPKVDEHRAALYELADALEASGETTRALAVLLDLVAEQDDYKDARARIERLSRVQA
jgi:tetratricopeptide (TPR) repeat protein